MFMPNRMNFHLYRTRIHEYLVNWRLCLFHIWLPNQQEIGVQTNAVVNLHSQYEHQFYIEHIIISGVQCMYKSNAIFLANRNGYNWRSPTPEQSS